MKDSHGMKAYDYCKLKKRSDLAVVLEEFVDTSNQSLNWIEYLNFDFKDKLKPYSRKNLT